MTAARTWLLLAYKVPREPTAARVYVWRKLKKLGALSIQDAVWVLPNTPATLEQLRWLAAEIVEMGGETSLWESRQLLDGQDAQLVRRFEVQAEQIFSQILADLRRAKPDLKSLSRQYREAIAQDYFQCDLAAQVREALIAARARPAEGGW